MGRKDIIDISLKFIIYVIYISLKFNIYISNTACENMLIRCTHMWEVFSRFYCFKKAFVMFYFLSFRFNNLLSLSLLYKAYCKSLKLSQTLQSYSPGFPSMN